MINIIKSSLWRPSDNIIYSEESSELEVIKTSRNCLVSAGPGAGKTELLAQKATFLLQTNKCMYPKKILALSVKVDTADNIKKRVEVRCGKSLSDRFVSKTYDSFFKSIFDQFSNLLTGFYRIQNKYDVAEKEDIIRAYNLAGLRFESLEYKEKNFYEKFYLTENSLPIIDSPYGEMAKKTWSILLRGNEKVSPKISFKMIARLVEYIIKENPMLKSSLELTYSHIFLDEFQDTTKEQYDVIKTCFKGTNTNITAVGDKKQKIMTWAGALDNIFEAFKLDFNAKEKTLLVNHRSVPTLIKLQNVIVEEMLGVKLDIEASENKSLDSGCSELWHFKDENDEAKFLCEKIYNLIEEKGVDKKEICVLTRMWPDHYCKKLIDKLLEVNIECRIEDEYQSLLREDIIKIILSVMKLTQIGDTSTEWIFIVDLIRKINGYNYYTKSEKINALERDIDKYIKELKERLYKITSKKVLQDIVQNIINYIGIQNLKSIYAQYRRGDYIQELIEKFLALFWKDYSVSKNLSDAIERFKGEYTIHIMSIHKSKGLEFNTIILLGVEGSSFWGIKNNPSEELCNFFVAVSRSKENLFFTYSAKRVIKDSIKYGQKNNVMLFYNLMKKSGVVDSYDLSDNFKIKCSEYYNIAAAAIDKNDEEN
ncbi:UvrD-helicase domain-containing protein [Clostridium thailandense]|uniref:UvrD-helicase domain-containing protein n=1 Tax=Clostridium thailandense TaxID=2794346 RepID=UPI003989422C